MATKQIIITKNQFEKLKKVFEETDGLEYLIWQEDNSNGIGPVVKLKYDDIEIDATDVDSW
jgi:hypothetical protein